MSNARRVYKKNCNILKFLIALLNDEFNQFLKTTQKFKFYCFSDSIVHLTEKKQLK